jgi:hypothetical protein
VSSALISGRIRVRILCQTAVEGTPVKKTQNLIIFAIHVKYTVAGISKILVSQDQTYFLR